MVVGEVPTGVDVLVIGGGPGGYAAALAAAGDGRTVTLVEQDRLGGVCLNVGCIPSKALIHAADLAAIPAEAAAHGIHLGAAQIDMGAVQARIGEVVARLTGGVASLLKNAGVDVVTGTARFATASRIAVWRGDDAHFYEPAATIVATGSRPAALDVLPIDGIRVVNSTGALALTSVPARMVVVGAGYIGVELGTAWAKLGTKVTIVEAADRILPGLPERLARAVARGLAARGVTVLTGATVTGVDTTRTDETRVVVSGGGAGWGSPRPAGGGMPGGQGPAAILTDLVVVAVGRSPNTGGLDLEKTGARLDGAGLVVVDPSRRAARGVYAIGDVTPGPALAHKAGAEAAVAGAAAAGRAAVFDPATVPVVVFSDPEIATVGLTVEAARAAGADPVSTTLALTASGRAVLLGHTDGFVEVVADRADGTVIGVHLAGPGVSELAYAAALAVEMGATTEDLALTIAPHPTLSEAFADAARMRVALTTLDVVRATTMPPGRSR